MPLLDGISSSPESLLKPYLEATIALSSPSSTLPTEAIFTSFYVQNMHRSEPQTQPYSSPDDSNHLPTILVPPPPLTILPESSNSAASNAEAVFWEAIRSLKSLRPKPEDFGSDEGEIETFWPPVEADPEAEEGEEW